MTDSSAAVPRVLVVEDEYLIRMLLEDMLDELGYGVAAAVGTISEARQIATNGEFNAAILDVNLDGQEIYPVADVLIEAGSPVIFTTGFDRAAMPAAYQDLPHLDKPVTTHALAAALAALQRSART